MSTTLKGTEETRAPKRQNGRLAPGLYFELKIPKRFDRPREAKHFSNSFRRGLSRACSRSPVAALQDVLQLPATPSLHLFDPDKEVRTYVRDRSPCPPPSRKGQVATKDRYHPPFAMCSRCLAGVFLFESGVASMHSQETRSRRPPIRPHPTLCDAKTKPAVFRT